ncbi:secretion protein HlyD [Pseudomonas mandelii JR-1]|uniref:Secretion protein HlyD n=1 Tax=Pseudomonas mandelii JR-1 TaxID=1147786 RepID=A0A024E6D0_9PSED|nr:secretion protein HlyD [Pseudomonas mandelii JR-1]
MHGGEFIPARGDHLPGGDGDNGDQTKCYKQGASGLSGTFHAGFRPMGIGPSFILRTKNGGRRTLSGGRQTRGAVL